MRLYHIAGTRSSRVRWALEEAGLPYEIESITREERKEPAHLARHPLGRVPVVHDGEGYVFESAALALHVADLAPAGSLVAAPGSHDRALQYQWVVYAMVEMETGVMERYLYGESDPARSAAGVERYRAAADPVVDA